MAERRSGAAEGLARLSEWADAHLSLLRSLSGGLAVAAVLVLARSVRMTTKFTSALDIPVAFVEKNVKLRGKLHRITEKGLEVEHVPISVPLITSLQRKWQGPGLLRVRLAGVQLAPGALGWLQCHLRPTQIVWFQLLAREDEALECLVLVNKAIPCSADQPLAQSIKRLSQTFRGPFLSVCLNEEILRQGLGRAARVEGLPHQSRLYWRLHKRLLRAELKALKKRKGIWKEERYSERIRDRISSNKFVQALKQFVSWLRKSV